MLILLIQQSDTCHAFASGLWTGDNWKELEGAGRKLDYFTHLKAIHLNNSKYPTEARKDRHANILSGHITKKQWLTFFHSPLFQTIPLILETPTKENYSHKEELALLKQWADSE